MHPAQSLLDPVSNRHNLVAVMSVSRQISPLPVGLCSSWLIFLKTWGHNFQSVLSIIFRDSASAMVFAIPGRCCAFRDISLSMHHSQRSIVSWFRRGDTVPPSLFMYAIAVVLSIFSSMVMLLLSLAKHFTAREAAKSSRQFMWRLCCSDSLAHRRGASVSWDMRLLPFQLVRPPLELASNIPWLVW